MPDDQVFDAKKAAEFLGGHVETIRRLARRGKIPAYKIGKDWRFRRSALLQWAETHHQAASTPSILVVDDDPGVRDMIRFFLEAEGYTVHEAENGKRGLELIKDQPIAAVLLDLEMPDMNGPEFLEILRKENKTTQVIIITGYPDSDLMAKATEFGPLTLLAKPLDRGQLLQSIHASATGKMNDTQK